MVPAGSKIKCAAGTLRAYLRRRTNDAKASFVSSRSLAARGSWGTAPSVFWHGAPGGTQGPLGKGGAAERWRVVYPIGIATRYGAQPATTRTHKRNAPAASRTGFAPCIFSATPLGDYKLSHPPGRRTGLAPCKINAPPLGDYNLDLKILLLLSFTEKERPRRAGVLPKPCTRPHPPPGDHQPAPKYHNKSQQAFP